MKLENKIKLMGDSFTKKEFSAIKNCLDSGSYTQGKIVDKFEKEFAKWNGSKYATMVNSGSSANLLIISAMKEKYNLKEFDEILVPSVTWPTTIFPIIQNGLSPVFCDVDESFNIDLKSIKKMSDYKTKGIFVVHLLGQPAKISGIEKFCKENNLFFVEDSCESQGATFNGKKVGNFGEMGSFSFYFGHHMTTIEGGMVTTNDSYLYDLSKSIRSHGWIKGTNRENNYPNFKNNSFVFDTLGYNIRSTDLNASIGLVQLNKVDNSIKKRIENHDYFIKKIKDLPLILQKIKLNETSSFCFGILFPNKKIRESALEKLPQKGIECRPIAAGNLLKQPIFMNSSYKKDSEAMANIIHEKGIYLPNNQFINKGKIDYMVNAIKEIL